MDNPYRLSENDRIIIDTRLDTLEKQAKRNVTWRLGLAVFATVAAVSGAYFSTHRTFAREAPCHDEVILVSKSVWVNSTVASCSHSKHKSEVTGNSYETSIHCVCR